MDVELIKSLATLAAAGVDVKTLLGQNQEPAKPEKPNEEKPDQEASGENISFETILKLIQASNKPEPKPEPKEEPKEEPKAEPKSEGLSSDQFEKLLQAMNTKNASIDMPDNDEWKKNLANHFSELINGNNVSKEEK
jgi:hypothetical protein